ncbi:hypothetical protein BU24DRAFT_420453 [Aaosphaeria arxii CBS 175.79]|uniref:Uncharacterized protein n=1 Tax=Aaosphaeria arxii CBS 175.79 TaxID=1450172 RepID=A0A6A5XWS7_9PLEO|nr:uncharacterized protein BU24DRAFT_420453 [Aaosphaeria arxii CBS 175.79]KAF2017406.1 hypothetical protein BU24DRAFT_420453 [Aaosphaeria arxii CBS 175.79]
MALKEDDRNNNGDRDCYVDRARRNCSEVCGVDIDCGETIPHFDRRIWGRITTWAAIA